MSNRTARLFSKKGFTLVELLIVVAIIGVLASQGVPAYQRMIQKSRRGEVQTLLGNIGSAEAGFFSEYSTYGNNIQRMGAQMEANNNLRYMGGFFSNTCGDQTVFPTAVTGFGGYTTVVAKSGTQLGSMQIGRGLTGTCPSTATSTAAAYIAAAIGNIDTSTINTAVTANSDTWTMDQNRQINLTVDGVR